VTVAAVLWDMDGTLLDGEDVWRKAHAALAAALGGHLDDDALDALVGCAIDTGVVAALLAGGHDPTPVRIVAAREQLVLTVIASYAAGIRWMPGARDALDAVAAAGVPMALVTNTTRPVVAVALGQLGRDRFAATVCGDDVPAGKPDPAPYRAAAALLGVPIDRCVAVEDSPTGADAATAAGAACLVVPGVLPVAGAPRRRFRDSLVGLTVADLDTVAAPLRPHPAATGRHVPTTPHARRQRVHAATEGRR
jgi:HAD superfamily hydrolase (TIGR01509 family)